MPAVNNNGWFAEDLYRSDQIISFQTAKLAKEKGFNETYFHRLGKVYYTHDGKLDFESVGLQKHSCKATSQTVLKKWLREKFNLELWVIPVSYNENYMVKGYKRVDKRIPLMDKAPELFVNEFSSSEEEALELGLQEALKTL
jgi:hypothetical protein